MQKKAVEDEHCDNRKMNKSEYLITDAKTRIDHTASSIRQNTIQNNLRKYAKTYADAMS